MMTDGECVPFPRDGLSHSKLPAADSSRLTFLCRLSAKPEEDILAGEGEDAGRKRKRIAVDDGKGGKKAKGGVEASAIAEDDFFGGGSDSE